MSFHDFRDRAHRGAGSKPRLVPVWRDVLLDADTPVAAFAKLRDGPFAFLLESAPAGGETWARYTFMGAAPRAAWKLDDGVVQDWTPERGWHNDRRPDDPLADLEALLTECEPVDAPEIGEFWSGAVGYFGYDVARVIERLPAPPAARRRGARRAVRLHRRPRHLRQPALAGAGRGGRAGRARSVGRRAHSGRTAPRRETIDATIARLRAVAPLAPLDLDAVGAAGRGHVEVRERQISRRRRARAAVHHRRRRVSGAGRAPHRRAVRLLVDRSLPRAARDQPVAVHVPPRARRRRDRRQLARAPRARHRLGHRHAPPDRRHAPPRPHAGGRPRDDRGASARREGARRAPHARRPRPERRRAHRQVRLRARDRADGRRALLARAAPREPGRRRAARRAHGDGCVPRQLPGRHAHRRAESARHGDHRRDGAGASRAVRRRRRLHQRRRQAHGPRDHHPHLRHRQRRGVGAVGGGGRLRLDPRARVSRAHEQGARAAHGDRPGSGATPTARDHI